MAKSTLKSIPWMAVSIMALVVGVAVFAWRTFQKGATKPLSEFYLPIALGVAGLAMTFFKPTRKVGLPALLAGGAILGYNAGTKASTAGMSRPSTWRYRSGQNRPAAALDRPARTMNGAAEGAVQAFAGSRAWG